ncbi:MAG TPA: hypothetical protein VN878_03665 [Usitatibacter sp.]|nr:hypothetical protein [Usitatibacter sp.]
MYACPWCERNTFSFWQKQSLGPIGITRCVNCTRRVGVPWGRAHVAALPILVLALIGMYAGAGVWESALGSLAGGVLGALLGMLLTVPLYHRYVPLIRPRS